ncbi:MAG: PstS family phosphate ABC transporter substrate-binding protein [Cytophagales bacterium]
MFFLFASCGSETSIIRIKGSDTEVNLTVALAESFSDFDDKTLISVSGGGSGLGITSLFNGNADIANSSRELNADEINRFLNAQKNIIQHVFAYDVLAFVVSNQSDIDSIDLDHLKKVLNGEIKNWQELNPKLSSNINIYGRQSNSGTFEYLKKTLDIQFSPFAKQMNGNAQIMEAVQADPTGIGYVSIGFLTSNPNHRLKALSIKKETSQKAISPLDESAVMKGDYFFSRPLFQFFDAKDSSKVKPFIEFEKSEKASKIIKTFGYFQNIK